MPILLRNKPPEAVIRHSKEREIESLIAPVEIYFDANESSDPDGDNDIIYYKWEIRDSKNSILEETSSRTFYYPFNNPGTYTVSLIIKDKGEKSSDALIILQIK